MRRPEIQEEEKLSLLFASVTLFQFQFNENSLVGGLTSWGIKVLIIDSGFQFVYYDSIFQGNPMHRSSTLQQQAEAWHLKPLPTPPPLAAIPPLPLHLLV
jgi:hypothetical protein